MKNLLERIMGTFYPTWTPDGDDDIMKFGSVEIKTEGLSEEHIEALGKINESYKNSGTEAIRLNTEFEDYKKANPVKETPDPNKVDPNKVDPNKVDPTKLDEMIEKLIADKLKDVTGVSDQMKTMLMNKDVSDTKSALSLEFKEFGKEKLDSVYEKTDEWFKTLPPAAKTAEIYKNYAQSQMSVAFKDDISSMESAKAMALLKNDPAQMNALMAQYFKDNKMDINMPDMDGMTTEAEFKTRMQTLKQDFNKRGTTIDQKIKIGEQMEEIKDYAGKFNWKVT